LRGDAKAGQPARPGPLDRIEWLSIVGGALFLVVPLVVTGDVARYLAAPVWLGFVMLLDPINRRRGDPSLLAESRAGAFDRTINLLLSGALCGVLWESLNYWAGAKWHYTVPVMPDVKIFEMPLPGYLGFPAFALECFAMFVFSRRIVLRPAEP